MRVGFVIFDDMTALDFIGVYDPVSRLRTMGFKPELEWDICSRSEQVRDKNGLSFLATKVDSALSSYDIVIFSGGPGTRKLIRDTSFVEWVRTANKCPLKVSVCTGALLLGAAGFLEQKRATTHHGYLELLREFCPFVVEKQRIVDEGDVITAGGVTSSIDLGLYLCEKLAGPDAKEKIRLQMEYPNYSYSIA